MPLRPSALVAIVVAVAVGVSAGLRSTPGVTAPPTREAKLTQTLATLVSSSGSPGGVLMVTTPAGTWRRALGLAQLKPERKMSPSARFRIASVTKTFTAALVLQLDADGVLSLEDTVERWLPGRLRGGAASVITVRQLLSHTSGIIDESPEWVATAASPYHYSNRNYLLLGEVVHAATGSTYETELSRRILRPLGLRRTEPSTDAVPPDIVHGYSPTLPSWGPHLDGSRHGDLRTCAVPRIADSAGAARRDEGARTRARIPDCGVHRIWPRLDALPVFMW